MRPRGRRLAWIAPLAILAMGLLAALGGALVMLLWNWLLPPLLGWAPIGFWQAIGLLALCRILFGGRGRFGPVRSGLRRRMQARLDRMTPEERQRCGQGMP